MTSLSTDPGLVTRIDDGWMYVKVPVRSGCGACARKSECTFSGPRSAYRTFRVRQLPECHVGDRVLVDVPSSTLTIAGIVLVIVPVAMMFGGYWLLQTWLRFPFAMPLLWLVGITAWLSLLFAVNKWMERSARFNERVTPLRDPPG